MYGGTGTDSTYINGTCRQSMNEHESDLHITCLTTPVENRGRQTGHMEVLAHGWMIATYPIHDPMPNCQWPIQMSNVHMRESAVVYRTLPLYRTILCTSPSNLSCLLYLSLPSRQTNIDKSLKKKQNMISTCQPSPSSPGKISKKK